MATAPARPAPPLAARLAALALAVLALAACESRITVTGCVRSSECTEPLVCLGGTCGSECDTARDCGADRRCVRVGAIGRCLIESLRQCDATTPCELDGLECRGERCYNTCEACAPDTVCAGGICVLPSADAGAPDAPGG